MFRKIRKYFAENIDTIAMGLAFVSGTDIRNYID